MTVEKLLLIEFFVLLGCLILGWIEEMEQANIKFNYSLTYRESSLDIFLERLFYWGTIISAASFVITLIYYLFTK